MTNDEYINHELRLQMLEKVTQQINSKMNTALMLLITAVIIPMISKYLGAE